jgi:SAM-dependent methyltransferase
MRPVPSFSVSALAPDYDSDPDRAGSFRLGWQEDVHGPVVDRLIKEGVQQVVDVGSGIGRFAAAVGGRLAWVGIDQSPRQLSDCPHRPVVRADATRLPVADGTTDAVVLLWMLYHLDDPRLALVEAGRVVRPGGLVVACTSNRSNDPELLPDGYPPTTFDGEEAAEIVSEIFGPGHVDVERWDAPMVQLRDREELTAYARSHLIPPEAVARVDPPVTLTKRGCLVWARRPAI